MYLHVQSSSQSVVDNILTELSRSKSQHYTDFRLKIGLKKTPSVRDNFTDHFLSRYVRTYRHKFTCMNVCTADIYIYIMYTVCSQYIVCIICSCCKAPLHQSPATYGSHFTAGGIIVLIV